MTLADLTPLALPFILGYALGAIPFGLLLTRLFGAGDIRAIGSGNIGATNVLRTGRKGLALATLLLDGGKGAAAVLLAGVLWAHQLFQNGGGTQYLAIIFASLGALIGHCFPVWLRFKGGKGVATMLGISFGLDWRIGLASALVWAAAARLTRISSVGGMASALAGPVVAVALSMALADHEGTGVEFAAYGIFALTPMALLIVWNHRANIARLRAGTEPRIGQKG